MTTRATLRRDIGLRTGQPFFRRFGGSAGAASASGTSTTLIDTAWLKEENNYWRGHFIYLPTTDVVREISAFTSATSTLTWLATTTATTQGQAYELWSQFTPPEVHTALNHALRVAWPMFFQYGEDESICIVADEGLEYTLPTTNAIRRLAQVYLIAYDSKTSTTTSAGTATQLLDTAGWFTSADVGKYVAIYEDGGTPNGDVRLVTARVSATELTCSAFSAAVSSGAKYRLIDKTNPYPTQVLMQNWKVDRPDNPTKLWIGGHPTGYEGHLLRLYYEYEYTTLSAETTDTTCPQEFLVNMALAYLYFQKLSTAPATEVEAWQAMYRAALDAAKSYIFAHRFTHLPSTMTRMDLNVAGVPSDYPFK